ncbi:MAG: hypothetical protein QXY49_06890 [Thermofilaceae archaeon]
MAKTSEEERFLEILAGLGYEIEKRLTEPGIAILVGVLLWAFWPTPIDTLAATCFLALLYYRKTRGKEPPELKDNSWLTAIGLVLIAWGLYASLGTFVNVPWQASLVLVGALLIALGYTGGKNGKGGSG